jgi:hypothetical protein
MEVNLRNPNFGNRLVYFVVYIRMPPVTLIIASHWSATDELTGQDLEGSGRSIIEVLSQYVWVKLRKTSVKIPNDPA